MREILFRGKRIDNGEWVEGIFLQDKDLEQYYIEYFDYYSTIDGLQRDYCQYEIIYETIGQYTGLIDKNGKKIFEGDIIDTPDRLVEVVWLKGNAQFDLNFIRYAHDIRISNFRGIEMRDLCDYEVIGNVHDNPELLKKE